MTKINRVESGAKMFAASRGTDATEATDVQLARTGIGRGELLNRAANKRDKGARDLLKRHSRGELAEWLDSLDVRVDPEDVTS